MSKLANVRKHILLLCRALADFKRVLFIIYPAARKIAPVVRIASSSHCDFVSVINHGNSPGRQQTSECKFQIVYRRLRLVHKPRHIMQAYECDKPVRIGIQKVVAEQARQLGYRLTVSEAFTEFVVKREIENRINQVIDAVVLGSASLKERNQGRV